LPSLFVSFDSFSSKERLFSVSTILLLSRSPKIFSLSNTGVFSSLESFDEVEMFTAFILSGLKASSKLAQSLLSWSSKEPPLIWLSKSLKSAVHSDWPNKLLSNFYNKNIINIIYDLYKYIYIY